MIVGHFPPISPASPLLSRHYRLSSPLASLPRPVPLRPCQHYPSRGSRKALRPLEPKKGSQGPQGSQSFLQLQAPLTRVSATTYLSPQSPLIADPLLSHCRRNTPQYLSWLKYYDSKRNLNLSTALKHSSLYSPPPIADLPPFRL